MGSRRARGEGSISWNRHHKYWEGRVVVGKKPGKDGTPVDDARYARSRVPGRAGEREVEAKLRALVEGVVVERETEAAASDPANYTLWQSLLDWHAWVTTTPRTSQQTADKYLAACAKWVKPTIGDVPLRQVDIELLSNFIEGIAENLGADSLQDLLGAIRRASNYAMREKTRTGFAGPNAADAVVLPEAGHAPRDCDFLDKAHVEAILTQTAGTPAHALMMTGFMLGLRPGEIRALKWENLDLKTGVVYIVKYARKTGDGKTKTGDSRRAIRLPRRLLAALAAHQANWGGHPYVFAMDDGGQFKPWNFRWRVKVVFREAGLDISNTYTMRHTFASIADDEGVPHQKIADMMGHRDVTTFERIYRHRLRPVITETADLMDDLWGNDDGEEEAA